MSDLKPCNCGRVGCKACTLILTHDVAVWAHATLETMEELAPVDAGADRALAEAGRKAERVVRRIDRREARRDARKRQKRARKRSRRG